MYRLRLTLVAFVLAFLALVQGTSAAAAGGYHLFGDAQIVSGGNPGSAAQLRSDADPGYGGVDFEIAAGLTFAQLTQLATDYNITDDQCGGGSPRFQLNTSGGNIFVYLGPSPAFVGCTPGWQSSGNLIGNNEACRYDTSQLLAGTQCNTYASTLALFGGVTITGIQLVVDSGWSAVASGGDGEETILVDNVQINDDTYTFESKDSCKNGGWRDFTSSPGPFKNQGECVSFFARGG
jgi:hypothetical protein